MHFTFVETGVDGVLDELVVGGDDLAGSRDVQLRNQLQPYGHVMAAVVAPYLCPLQSSQQRKVKMKCDQRKKGENIVRAENTKKNC